MVPSDRRTQRQRSSRDPVARELGQSQADIMNVLWRRKSGATVPELHDAINAGRAKRRQPELAYTSVLTLVQRLHGRGLLERVAEGRGFRYTPAMGRDELLASWSDDLINRLLSDFGDAAVVRLEERLQELDGGRLAKLRAARRKR